MSDTTTTTPKKRGRPKGPRPALTSAERMRLARERVRFALDDPEGDITALPDLLLLEAVALAYRKDRRGALFYGVEALFERLNARTSDDHAYVVHLERIPKSDTVTTKATDDTDTVTEKESEDTDTVTDTPALSLEPSPPARSDAELIAILKANGWTQARIAQEIERDPGRVSRAIKHGQKLDEEAHGRLLALVAEVERDRVS
ncbi:helix-turn-helix domain-containing protein [Thiohalocapsa marina]|uniref:helix-turn-helix domain-containing protein n=1 Tax=Thiohalocapsa marina TaxID=424902 RepID=UPI0036DF3083